MTEALTDWRSFRSLVLLFGFLLVVIGVGSAIGFVTAPGEWYAGLDKPPFNPPNWLFAPVWFVLYVFIAVAGWRTFRRDAAGTTMKVWIGQMVLNWLWSPVFFVLHWLWPAGVLILVLLALIVGFIVLSWREDRVSAWLFMPYAAWVGFASILNLAIAQLN
jgi:tryptophan-rich sensory protein